MNSTQRKRISLFFLVYLLLVTTNCLIFLSLAQEEQIKPPEPILEERNNWNIGTYHVTKSIHMSFDLGPNLDFEAAIINGTDTVDEISELIYQHNVKLKYQGNNYMFEFSVKALTIECQSEYTEIDLLDASNFYASLDEIIYQEDYYPTFSFNVTFEDINVPTYGQGFSNFSIHMNCKFIIDVNKTTVKLETMFNLTNFRYFSPSTYVEPAVDTPYSISLYYDILAFNRTDPEDSQTWTFLSPTYNQQNISYNLGSEEYEISSLYIEDTFLDVRGSTIEQGTATSTIDGHPSIPYALQACHTFSNLAYKNTIYIISDPTIILNFDPNSILNLILIISGSISAVVVITIMIIYLKKKKKQNIST